MNNRGVILGIFIILLIGIVSATPYILFVDPTPADATETTGSSVVINSTIENISTLNEFVFNWQGTNYSLYDEDLILMLNLNNNSNLGENDSLVYDSSRGRHNGTITGTILNSSGKYQGGLSIDADDEYINLSDDSDFRGENFTISFWYNKSSVGVKQISLGGNNECVLLDTGHVYCWGDNDYGQLGDGSTNPSIYYVRVLGNYNFSSFANFDYPDPYHNCGLLHNGSTLCWGRNTNGRLGIGNTTDMSTPVYVSGGYNFSMVSLGNDHSCGLLYNGSALCWGENGQGGLGIGNTTDMYNPHYVSGGHNFSSISCGDSNTCGLLHNGSTLCWGRNDYGQLGIGNTTQMYLPTYVYGDYNFKFIKNGNDFACGLLHNGSALCWGQNTDGALGIGNETDMYTPQFVSGGYNFSYLEAIYHGNCGLLHNGSTLCWGWNPQGQLGDNTTIYRFSPTYVSGGHNFSLISIGSSRACGIDSLNKIHCWGRGHANQPEQGLFAGTFPFPILFDQGTISSESFSQIFLGFETNCGLLHNGSALCWGYNVLGQIGDGTTNSQETPTYVSGGHNFSLLNTGGTSSCGLLHNGSALCWGSNTDGQLGIGNTTDIITPVYVSGGYNFSSISAGKTASSIHSCGLLHNGSALCWGSNTYGQLGIGNTTQMNAPFYVSGGHNFSSIKSGMRHSCGLLHNGSALCWGWNSLGSLGIGNTTQMNAPFYVSGGHNFSSISLGAIHSCGLLHNGSALCWGGGLYESLGLGEDNTTNMYTPTYVVGGHNFSLISYGSCGLLYNGSSLCWGINLYGQLGDGTHAHSGVPKFVLSDEVFSNIKKGNSNFFGVLNDGRIIVWGKNNYGQLGFSSFDYNVPTLRAHRGKLISKSLISFEITHSFGGDLRIIVNKLFENIELNEGFNNIIVNNNGTRVSIYINGVLNSSFDSLSFEYPTDLSNLIIGEDSRGQLDEILMWNRTLTAAEINQVYLSSLQQKNHTAWEFYSTQTLSSVGTYTYKLFATDTLGSFNVIRSIIKYVVEEESSGGSGTIVSPTYTIKEEKLKQGYTRWFRAKNEIKLEFGGQGSKTLEILSVDKDENIVKVSVNSVEVEITNGTSEKIDVNSDGFYDLELSLLDISNTGSSRLTFKEIYEEIPSDKEEGVEEEVKEEGESSDEEDKIVSKKLRRTWVYFIIGGIILIGFIVFFALFRHKK